MTSDRVQVDTLLLLLDHTLEESAAEFGWDHWHSLIRNLATVRPDDWDQAPTGDGDHRTIRQLVRHIGAGYLIHADRAFGEGNRFHDDVSIDGREPGETPEEMIAWLRSCHAAFRAPVAQLTDADLLVVRTAGWGDPIETRRLIELMIQHPLYHIGEINHIRSLLQDNDDFAHQDMAREEIVPKED